MSNSSSQTEKSVLDEIILLCKQCEDLMVEAMEQFNHLMEHFKTKYENDNTTSDLEQDIYDVQRWMSWIQDAAKAIIDFGKAISFLYKKLIEICETLNRIYKFFRAWFTSTSVNFNFGLMYIFISSLMN